MYLLSCAVHHEISCMIDTCMARHALMYAHAMSIPPSIFSSFCSDRDCTGEVSLQKLLTILQPSQKLAEYVTIQPFSQKKDSVNVTLTQLLQRLFAKTHKQQMEQVSDSCEHFVSAVVLLHRQVERCVVVAMSMNVRSMYHVSPLVDPRVGSSLPPTHHRATSRSHTSVRTVRW